MKTDDSVLTPPVDVAVAVVDPQAIEPDHVFEHGVLFVHGIGPHYKRETLTKFGEPILEYWSSVLANATNIAIGERDSNVNSDDKEDIACGAVFFDFLANIARGLIYC